MGNFSVDSIRWGIFGTGFVATKFALGLKAIPSAEIFAVASRSKQRAESFVKGIDSSAFAGSYTEVVALDNLDVVYIASPPSIHKEHALMCIAAGKSVLIEKPLATSAEDAKEIAAAAASKGVFCMEAMWTRFTPLIKELKRLCDEGSLGDIRIMSGSFCLAEEPDSSNHLFSAEMGGGALLDRAVYPLSLAVHLNGVPDHVGGYVVKGDSGIDEHVAVTLAWDNKCVAQFQASLIAQAENNFMISGTKKSISVNAPIYRPYRMKLSSVTTQKRQVASIPSKKDHIKENHWVHAVHQKLAPILRALIGKGSKSVYLPYSGNAYHYQAEEVMKCMKKGLLESPVMPLKESIAVLEIVDSLRT
ncbi:MAG: putative dehydrogenase [Cellvibrionaceae bacterium]